MLKKMQDGGLIQSRADMKVSINTVVEQALLGASTTIP